MHRQSTIVSPVLNRPSEARLQTAGIAALSAMIVCLACSAARAEVLFSESFNGYWSFPDEVPDNDPINPGLPRQSEGADEFWYGGRFEPADDDGSINSDLAVQKYGGGSNNSHTGRVSDDAGILFQISTVNLESAELHYDWRTFLAESPDLLRVGYFVGDLDFDGSRFYDFNAEFGSNWWNTDWVQITSGRSNSWQHVESPLPLGEPSVWIAFWLDGENCDYGKIDNICVTGNVVVPEPTSVLLAVMGAACLLVRGRRRIFAGPRVLLDSRAAFRADAAR
jgi:hypothetical protein